MKAKAILLGLVVCFMGATVCFAQDGFLGTWKLNEAKSKIGPGASKNSTVVYEAVGDSVKITIDGTAGDGKPFHSEWTGKYDGKDYPVTGNPYADDMVSFKKVDEHTLTSTFKKGGKVTARAKSVLSADGKSRTATGSRTDANGKKISIVAVYDKQ